MEITKSKLFYLIKTIPRGVVAWILSVTIIGAPLTSCQMAFMKPQISTSVSQLTANEAVGVAETDKSKASVLSSVQFGTKERAASVTNNISVLVDGKNAVTQKVDKAERKIVRELFPNVARSAIEGGFESTEETSTNSLDFILDTSNPLTEADTLVYNTIVNNISSDSRLVENKQIALIDDLIDLTGLEEAIQSALFQNERIASVSRNAQEELTESDILLLTQTIQKIMNEKGSVIATQVLPAAEIMNEVSNEVILKTLNSPLEGLDDAASRTIKKAKSNNSRVVSSNPKTVDTRADLANLLKEESNIYSETMSGDLLYTFGPGLGTIISGHGAIWDKVKKSWFTAGKDSTSSPPIIAYFSSKNQIDTRTSETAMKLLSVNSSKTETERKAALDQAYNKYNNRSYLIQPFKSYDSAGLYCSQVAWLVWKTMDVDIDGAWWSSSFLLQDIVQKIIPVTLTIGWIEVTIYITIFVILVNLLTLDVIYPWDMVIDDNTKEYARFGKAYPAEW